MFVILLFIVIFWIHLYSAFFADFELYIHANGLIKFFNPLQLYFCVIVIAFHMHVYSNRFYDESISSNTILLILQENISQDKRRHQDRKDCAKNNKNS